MNTIIKGILDLQNKNFLENAALKMLLSEKKKVEKSLDNLVTAIENGVVSTFINIVISNIGETAMKLYSLFPGKREIKLNSIKSGVVNPGDYSIFDDNENNDKKGVWFKYQSGVKGVSKIQTQNQFITFRINDIWTNEKLYDSNAAPTDNNLQSLNGITSIDSNSMTKGMIIYPFVSTEHGLCIDSDNVKSYVLINPGEEVVVPMYCEFIVKDSNDFIEKTISFDLRTSLYTDPTNYSFKVVAKNTSSAQDKLTIANKKRFFDRLVNPVKYNTTVK